jgi:hypothetical protein
MFLKHLLLFTKLFYTQFSMQEVSKIFNKLTTFFKLADGIRFTEGITLNEEVKAIDTAKQLIKSLHNFKQNN